MSRLADHLIVAPILLPLVAGAFMLLLDERTRRPKAIIAAIVTLALLGISIALLVRADTPSAAGAPATTAVYLLGNWPARIGIVLVADRLSALMLVLTSILALAALVFSIARWDQAGPRFHSMFQFLLMGLNGAFLTGDLFNLFVFFEVLLAASYGLALHGSGTPRVKAGLHYIAVNLIASSLFLIGVSLIYSVTGTLNLADLATRIPAIHAVDRVLLEAGAAVLGVAFFVKAGIWPLCFWLPSTYAASATPVAAIFAIMSKIGIYVILRFSLLLFGETAGASAHLGGQWLLIGGMATMAFGSIGVLAAQTMPRLAGYSALVSSGTLLAAIGTGNSAVIGGALFYMVSSTLTLCALFLLIELVERARDPAADILAVTMEAYGETEEAPMEDAEVGVTFPAAIALLGSAFAICTLLLAGLPPLSGFIGKFAILASLLNPALIVDGTFSPATWSLVALLVLSGLAALITMTRMGIHTFWVPQETVVPRVRVIEAAPVAALLLVCVVLTIGGGPAMRYMAATAQNLTAARSYIDGVLSSPRVPPAGSSTLEPRP